MSNNLNVLMKRLAIITVIFGLLNIPASMDGMSEFSRYVVDNLQVSAGMAYLLFTLGMGLLGWLCYRALAFFQVFSVDSSPTWRGRRRKWKQGTHLFSSVEVVIVSCLDYTLSN